MFRSTDAEVMKQISAAIRANDLAAAKRLFSEHPEQLEAYTPFAGGTWLHFSAARGAIEIVQYLLGLGMGVNEGDMREGQTALKDATYAGHYEVAEFLLDHGAVMDVSASIRNPMFGAIVGGSLEIARLLIDRGIDTSVRYNSPTMKNMDAIAFAWMQGEHEIARMIAEKHAGGDTAKIDALLAEADGIAHANTVPIKPGEEDMPVDPYEE